MGHYKNRKPKGFKGCCTMCSYRSTDGTRTGRQLTRQEQRAEIDEVEQVAETGPSRGRLTGRGGPARYALELNGAD